MFSVKRVWLQEVVTERDKISRLFTNQIVKNAQELKIEVVINGYDPFLHGPFYTAL